MDIIYHCKSLHVVNFLVIYFGAWVLFGTVSAWEWCLYCKACISVFIRVHCLGFEHCCYSCIDAGCGNPISTRNGTHHLALIFLG